jgi:hypothetical protein
VPILGYYRMSSGAWGEKVEARHQSTFITRARERRTLCFELDA